tara:strand:- start:24054 stop:24329 length:276 start_codon:yes stop_codon:yes gene_type:complete
MKDNSSKQQMENSLKLLSSIERVDHSENLLLKIERKIESAKENVVPLTWVKLAAAVFVCVLFVEIFVLSNSSESNELTELIQTADNTLYDE